MQVERKIEIATAVMNDPYLGLGVLTFTAFVPYAICACVYDYCDNEEDTRRFIDYLRGYAVSINIPTPERGYWFSAQEGLARTERIAFLEKNIEHLKQQQ